jgi:hypothetical protein
MTFTTPLLAGIIAAIAIPTLIILYFLKLRRKPMDVSTTLLWKKSIMDIRANAPFQKLRRNILLLLQLLVLILLVAALSQPRTERASVGGQRLVIMLDRSASMASVDAGDDAGASRLAAAQDAAVSLIESLRDPGLFDGGGGDEAMVIAFDAAAEVLAPFTNDKRALIAAVRSVRPTDAPTSIEEAYRLAQAQKPGGGTAGGADAPTDDAQPVPTGPGYAYHLFSDGRIPDAAVFLAGDGGTGRPPEFVYHTVGNAASANIGIVALRAERAFDDPARLSVFVGMQSTDRSARSVDVEMLVDGRLAAVRGVEMPAAEVDAASGTPQGAVRPSTGGVVFELREPNAVRVTIRLAGVAGEPFNALGADDAGTLIVPAAKRSAVALVGPGSLFLTEALRGLPLSRFETLTPDAYESLRASGEAARFDLIVLDRYLPQPGPAGAVLDPGRYLVFGAVPLLGVEDLGEAGPGGIIDWRRNHPALRSITLDGLVIGRTRPMAVPDDSGAVSLAETAGGPAIVEISDGSVRALVASFDLGQTNWPFQVGFVVYLASAIDYLAGNAATEQEGGSRQIAPGGVLADRVPAGATGVRVVSPEGEAQTLVPAADGRVVYGPIRDRGVYRLEWLGPGGEADLIEGDRSVRFYAANLLDPAESDITPASELGLADRLVAARAAETSGLLELWPFVVLGALAIMMFEWWVYNRRVSI